MHVGRAGLWAIPANGKLFGDVLWASVQVQRRFPDVSLFGHEPALAGTSGGRGNQ